MSWVVNGNTVGSSPLTHPIRSSIRSGRRSSQPSLATGVSATPRRLTRRLPRVVSTDRIAAMRGCTSCDIIVRIAKGDFIIGTG
ncbi:hypothetical protein D3C72_2454700 [compost metagenome]